MRKFGLLFFALVMIAPMLAGRLSSEVKADVWLSVIGVRSGLADHSSGLIVKVKKKKKKQDDGGNTTQGGERSCPAGYVVLDKPNKYGSFCEPKEGLPTTPTEPCKFGMIGKPPDCTCPKGTRFAGYQGCIPTTKRQICVDGDVKAGDVEKKQDAFSDKCHNEYKGGASCQTLAVGTWKCCCFYEY